jgi:shikimate dehydrogenase
MKKYIFNGPQLCISIAKRPGLYGTTVHNAGYQALGLNFFYKAFGTNDLEGAIHGVRALGIRGCSVSMPFKERVIPLLDKLDILAKKSKAVNTIVNENGHLIGYNTDVIGIKQCLQPLKIKKNKKLLLLGSGGISRAFLVALRNLKLNDITISNRTLKKSQTLAKEFDTHFIKWSERNNFNADMIINATSVGMSPDDNLMPISENQIRNTEILMDVVASPSNTKLIKFAKKCKKYTISGPELSFYQACEQFKLYTCKKPPIKDMQKAAKKLLLKNF